MLTASLPPVLFFEKVAQKKKFVDALDKITVSILGVLTLFPYHDFQGPNAIDWHVTGRKPGRRSPGTNDAAGRAQNGSGFMSAERYVFFRWLTSCTTQYTSVKETPTPTTPRPLCPRWAGNGKTRAQSSPPQEFRF